jgi:predicted alpha-1,2-mannosidase
MISPQCGKYYSPGVPDLKSSIAALLTAALLCVPAIIAYPQVTKDVDPFLGIDGGGNTIPGPSLPFGMIKPGPDMGPNSSNSGWERSGAINGFSQTHVSGTGGGAKYGNVLIQPTIGPVQPHNCASPRSGEHASIGYYRVTLARYPIDVEITTSARSAIYRFTYTGSGPRNLLIDAGHVLSSAKKAGEGQTVTASIVHVISSTELSGSSSVTGGWNKQTTPYTVYFFAVSDTPAESFGTWENKTLNPSVAQAASPAGAGGWMSFPQSTSQVNFKIAISFVSVEQARRNLAAEIPDFDFDRLHRRAVYTWENALSRITIDGATQPQRQIFYSALYHVMLMPVDRSGENPLWQSSEPYYDDYYAIWDTFRTSAPLLTLIAPDRQIAMLRSLIDIYRHEGWLPDARSGNFNGRTQGGSNADILLADAFVKHLAGIDWQTAYAGMVKDAEITPLNQLKEGRGGLDDWHNLGYVSIEGVDRPGSKQMEYAADDFALATVAKGLDREADFQKYLQRSHNWANLWDSSVADDGVQGFIRPRHKDGSWKANFTTMQSCSWGGDTFYEGNSWTYSLFVPHDVAGLMAKSGGPDAFVARLDAFFRGAGRYDVGNEPGFLSPYLYIWAGRHDRTAEQVRRIVSESYHTGRSGLPGNDDSGAMSSWYIFSAMGLMPNAGQDVYLIGSPAFPAVTLYLAENRTFVVEARNVSPQNKYVTAAELNGRPLHQAWLRHDQIEAGGKLVLTMSSIPSNWPAGPPPPSLSPP